MAYKTFETERLILRPTSEHDAEFILKLLNSPKFLKYVGDRNVKTTKEAKAYIRKKMTPQLERLGYANYTLITKTNNSKIGTCGLYDREGLEGVDIGFALLPEYEGKGYGFESSNKIKYEAIHRFKINQLKAITSKDNYSSQKLLKKLEFNFKGTTYLPDDNEELLLYIFETE